MSLIDKLLFESNKTQLCPGPTVCDWLDKSQTSFVTESGWWGRERSSGRKRENITASPDRVKSQETLPLGEGI